jgi:hypothetical protein
MTPEFKHEGGERARIRADPDKAPIYRVFEWHGRWLGGARAL